MDRDLVSWSREFLSIEMLPVPFRWTDQEWKAGQIPNIRQAVYAFEIDGRIQYVGETDRLVKRMNEHAGNMTRLAKPRYIKRYPVTPESKVTAFVGEVPMYDLGGVEFQSRCFAEDALIAAFHPPGNIRRRN